MTKQKYDCPHCGQDLRLSPDAKDEIDDAKIEGFREASKEIYRLQELVKAKDDSLLEVVIYFKRLRYGDNFLGDSEMECWKQAEEALKLK